MGFDFVMSTDMIQDAKKRGCTLSALLETLDPTHKLPQHEQTTDAFQRQLMRYDIRTASDPEIGLMSHTWERFEQAGKENSEGGDTRALAAEWVTRQYKKSTRITPRNGYVDGVWTEKGGMQPSGQRFPVDAPISYSLYPPAVYDQLRFQQIQPSLLSMLVARIRTINSESFDALYLTDSTANTAARLSRVEEFGEIPRQKFTTGEQIIRVRKYGGGLDVSYEQMRRMQLDLVSWWISYVAAKSDRDKEDTAVDVLINGDGNTSSAATVTNGTTLDAASANKLTLKMWLLWRLGWVRPYTSNIVIAANAGLVDLFLLQAGSANIGPTQVIQNNMPQAVAVRMARTTLDSMQAVDNSTVPANQLLSIDANWALEMVLEAGSQIVETDKIVQNQFSSIFISENVGWAIAIKGQNKILAYTL